MGYQQKYKAMADFKEKQFQEDLGFQRQVHQDYMAYLKKSLDANSQLTDQQKQERLNFEETQFQDNIKFLTQLNQEDINFFKKLADTPNLTPQQIKEKRKDYHNDRKKKLHRHKEDLRTHKLKSENK